MNKNIVNTIRMEMAFTLIELLVVIAIIGILAGFIIVSMSGASDVANDSRRKADINQLSKAVMIWKVNNPDTLFPIDADGCNIGDDCTDIFGEASVLRDPDGSYYTYNSSDGVNFNIRGVLSNEVVYMFSSGNGNYGTVSFPMIGWSKRRSVTINNNSGLPLVDYQVLMEINYDTDMQADFDDIRFANNDASINFPYWIESKIDGVSAKVWVKISSLQVGNTDIYLYYGNESVVSGSDGSSTFVFFDDFNSLDNWSVLGSPYVSGGICNIETNADVTHYGILSTSSFGNGFAVRSRLMTSHFGVSGVKESFGFGNDGVDIPAKQVTYSSDSGYGGKYTLYSTNYSLKSIPSWTINTYNIQEIRKIDSNLYFLVNGGNEVSFMGDAQNDITSEDRIIYDFYKFGGVESGHINIDWVLVRKIVSVEPIISIGEEE